MLLLLLLLLLNLERHITIDFLALLTMVAISFPRLICQSLISLALVPSAWSAGASLVK